MPTCLPALPLQGELEVTTEAGSGKGKAAGSSEDVVERLPFLLLGLDLPPPPLFKDVMEKNIIPQVRDCLPGCWPGGWVWCWAVGSVCSSSRCIKHGPIPTVLAPPPIPHPHTPPPCKSTPPPHPHHTHHPPPTTPTHHIPAGAHLQHLGQV
jgi:hypothetical protein